MESLGRILVMRGRALRNVLRQVVARGWFRIVTAIGLGTFLWFILFWIFRAGFRTITKEFMPEDIPTVFSSVFSLFFFTLLLMLVFSNAIIGFGSLFRSEETRFLLATPTRPEAVYSYRLIESLVFSSWAFAVLGLPMMIANASAGPAAAEKATREAVEAATAAGATAAEAAAAGAMEGGTGISPLFHAGLVLYFPPFVVLAASLGMMLSLLLTAYFPRRRVRALVLIGAAILVPILYMVWKVLVKIDFSKNLCFPSYWLSKGLIASGAGDWLTAALFGLLLLSGAFLVWRLGIALAAAVYPAAYSRASGHESVRRRRGGGLLDRLVERIDPVWPGVPRMMMKDFKSFLRDPAQWSQGLIFFGILAVYFANIRRIHANLDNVFWRFFVSFLNLACVLLTLATLATRFVYPLFSLEGRRFWILWLAPIPRSRIVIAKFLYCFLGTLLIAEPLIFLSNMALSAGGTQAAGGDFLLIQAVTVFFVCLAISGMIVGLGALFPSFGETNPSKIISGVGGTLALIYTVAIVVTVTAAEWTPCRLYVLGRISQPAYEQQIMLTLAAVGVLSMLAAFVPMALAVRSLRRFEF